MLRILAVAVVSLLLTHGFFLEYRPGIRAFEVPYDLKGFHYPLAQQAFQSLKDGRFPEWDPSLYSGLPYAANVQAALFSPASWLLYLASWRKPALGHPALQDLVFLHVWLAFFLCFLWLRWRGLAGLAAVLGACIYAISGYMMLQLQHLGLALGYPWIAFALWGIDQSERERRWQPLWKTAAASALCFVAGYTPFWVAFCIGVAAYAAARRHPLRALAGTTLAIAVSMLLAAVQWLPAIEASKAIAPEARYGGIRSVRFFMPYFIPNFGDFSLGTPLEANPGIEYLYLGSAGLVGLAALFFTRTLTRAVPALAMLSVSLYILIDPSGWLYSLLSEPSLASMLLRDWYFLGNITAAAALIAALGLDALLSKRTAARASQWLVYGAVMLAAAWSVRLMLVWLPEGAEFASGFASAADAAIGVALFTLLVFAYRRSAGFARIFAATAIVALAVVEYKAFGTAKRFNATRTGPWAEYPHSPLPFVHPGLVHEMRSNPDFRVATDGFTVHSTELRHARLTTPQGFDPYLPRDYRALVAEVARFETDREFELDLKNDTALHLFGVRYIISREGAPGFGLLKSDSRFRLRKPGGGYMKVFEYLDSRPAYGWDTGGNAARTVRWEPELRIIEVDSAAGGRFRLSEQLYPGWRVSIDGRDAALSRCHRAYQCVDVPPGPHRLDFRFRSETLRTGAVVSAASCIALAAALWLTRRRRLSEERPALSGALTAP